MLFFSKIGRFATLFLLFFASKALYAQDSISLSKIELNGYVKYVSINTFQNLEHIVTDQQLHNRLNLKYYPSQQLTATVEIRNRFIAGHTMMLNPDYAIQLQNSEQIDLSWAIVSRDAAVLLSEIDRLNLAFTTEKWQVTLGRQRINWGKNLVWNPNDLFNPYNFFDYDYEERPGADALRVQRFFTGNSSLEAAADYAKVKGQNTLALKYNFHKGPYDFQVLTAKYHEDYTLGMGWEGAIQNLGTKGEISYFITPSENETQNPLLASLSFDYYFKNGLSVYAGFLYNSLGISKQAYTDISMLSDFRLSAKNLMPNRWTFFTQWQKSPTPALSTGFSVMYARELNSVFVIPQVSYSIAQNWDFDTIWQLYFGKETHKFENLSNQIFLRFRWSF